MINKKTLLSTALIAAALTPALTMASGYKINEQSAAGMGTAHAGRAAMATDASVVFYNPAAMTELDRAQITAGFTYIKGIGDFDGTGTDVAGGTITDSGSPFSDGGNYLGEAFIPHVYYVQPINENLAFGLGVFAPFGTNTNYDDDFVGGGFADETSLTSIEIQPSIAFKINDQLSIGGGLDIVYMEGLLSKFVDSVPYSAQLDAVWQATPALTVGPNTPLADSQYQGNEGHYEVEGSDWGYGWNLGLYYKLSDATTLGFAYRSEIEIELKGDSTFANNEFSVYSDGGTTSADATSATDVSWAMDDSVTVVPVRDQASEVPLTTPQSATFSVTHQATDELLLQAGATWTGWSSFEYFDVIATENTAGLVNHPTLGVVPSDGVLDISDVSEINGLSDGYIGHIVEKWEDVWAVSIGGTYQLNDRIALRAGYAYDQSPVTDKYRTARVPASDRQWLTAGVQYVVTADLSFDVAAGYLFMDTMSLDETNKGLDDQDTASKTSVTGEYEIDVFGLSAQVNYQF